MKATTPIKPSIQLRGCSDLAREFGVTPGHLSRVIRGERRSPRLEAALAALGVRIRKGGAK